MLQYALDGILARGVLFPPGPCKAKAIEREKSLLRYQRSTTGGPDLATGLSRRWQNLPGRDCRLRRVGLARSGIGAGRTLRPRLPSSYTLPSFRGHLRSGIDECLSDRVSFRGVELGSGVHRPFEDAAVEGLGTDGVADGIKSRAMFGPAILKRGCVRLVNILENGPIRRIHVPPHIVDHMAHHAGWSARRRRPERHSPAPNEYADEQNVHRHRQHKKNRHQSWQAPSGRCVGHRSNPARERSANRSTKSEARYASSGAAKAPNKIPIVIIVAIRAAATQGRRNTPGKPMAMEAPIESMPDGDDWDGIELEPAQEALDDLGSNHRLAGTQRLIDSRFLFAKARRFGIPFHHGFGLPPVCFRPVSKIGAVQDQQTLEPFQLHAHKDPCAQLRPALLAGIVSTGTPAQWRVT